ncbi:nuclease [Shewanella decolorationis S12]|uniref:Nuclease n=1 Tax=Shewanella decolorationis S12 TaxID=1353536 RepID=A0ABN0PKY2_9GAMM|nr:nuclease [Shewanella decolorationis S12]GLR32229.1 nuclease [Shewanella decolorationis]
MTFTHPTIILNKIALFVDVQNIYYTCREAYQRQFNYRKLWQQLSAQGEIVGATAYAINRGDEGQLKFQDALRHIGFELKLKPFIQRTDGSAKGDWDVGITIDVLETAPKVDTVILLSGDGDFALLLDKIRQKYDIRAEVYGVPQLTAKSLIDAATRFNPINDTLLL